MVSSVRSAVRLAAMVVFIAGSIAAPAALSVAQTGGQGQQGQDNLQGPQRNDPGAAQPNGRAPGSPDVRQPASIAGRYTVTGRNFNGASYRGSVVVTPAGETYRVFWVIGSERYTGVGILTGDVLSVAYNGGLAVYRVEGDTLRGTWTTMRGGRVSTEDWRKAQ